MIKYILALSLLLSCESSSIIQHYRRAETALDPVLKEFLLKHETLLSTEGNGPAIFLKNKIFSLESNQDLSPSDAPEMSQLGHDLWIATGTYEKNTLTISIGQAFGNQFIKHVIVDEKIHSEFRERYKSDAFLKLKKSDSPVDELIIPLERAEVELSKRTNFIPGELIYGKTKMVSQPYYLKSFDFDFTHIKREYEYYFKFKVKTM